VGRRLPSVAVAGCQLAEAGRRFYRRGWVLGTSGNFSAVVSRRPLQLAITPSAAHKGTLSGQELLVIDKHGRPAVRPPRPARGRQAQARARGARAKPSAEALLHLEIVKARGAGAVLHTHSVWSTILSDLHAHDAGLAITGYEMLKGLDGVRTHEHLEWIPIVGNDQNMTRLAGVVRSVLGQQPRAHAFLLHRHGLYTWGRTIADAERHVEILEFLLEAAGRRSSWPS
jgi:methylthioribulose-1-phosphate dehydratase